MLQMHYISILTNHTSEIVFFRCFFAKNKANFGFNSKSKGAIIAPLLIAPLLMIALHDLVTRLYRVFCVLFWAEILTCCLSF